MTTSAGQRTELVEFFRVVTAPDDSGEERGGVPGSLGKEFAAVIWGSGRELRVAAAEEASQAATFVCLSTARTRGITVGDTLTYQGKSWDIASIVLRKRTEIEFNATRSG